MKGINIWDFLTKPVTAIRGGKEVEVGRRLVRIDLNHQPKPVQKFKRSRVQRRKMNGHPQKGGNFRQMQKVILPPDPATVMKALAGR